MRDKIRTVNILKDEALTAKYSFHKVFKGLETFDA
jgi:hypothetical protein